MATSMKKFTIWSLAVVMCLTASFSQLAAQSNPTPFDLNLGSYSMTNWPASSPAGTYPANMVFHMVANIDEDANQVSTGDFNCAYTGVVGGSTGGARIFGRDASGFAFINTGTLVCNCSYVGSAVLALNTTNRAQINVGWTSQTTALGQRPYGVRLQYRIGSTGSWTDVVSAGQVVEYMAPLNTSGVATTRTITAGLPTVCENKPLVQLRWVYYQRPVFSSGSRPQIQVDDISVTSNSTVGTATQLAIEAVSPASPAQNTGFALRVRSVDGVGAAKNVTTPTTVQVQLNTGTGFVSGSLTGVIPAGSSFVDLTNVIYSNAEAGVVLRAVWAGGQFLNQGLSAPLTFQAPAAYATITGATQFAYAGAPLTPFTVNVYRADNVIDGNYSSVITVTKVSGPGVVTGTASVAALNGLATFDNLSVSAPGDYTLQVTIPGLGVQTLPFTTAYAVPSMTTNIVPQYIAAAPSITNTAGCVTITSPWSLPSFALVTFSNLTPNTTYRLNTGLATDQNLTSTGGGFNLHYNANENSYFYSAGKSLTANGEYSQFSTLPGETSKSVWVNLITSTNIAFKEGNTIYWRVALGDANGNLISRYQLANTSSAIRTGTAANQATGIVDDASQLTAKNYVLLYDNTAGAGRPITVALVQAQGTTIAQRTETWYASRENRAGAWATLIPNSLLTGVRRIEERDARTNAVVYAVTSADGVWNGIQTNPSDLVAYPGGPGGFAAPIVLQTPRITVSNPKTGDTLCAGQPASVSYVARGMNNVTVEFSSNNGASWDVVATATAAAGTASWIVPAIEYAGACRIRVTGVERTDISGTSQSFAVASKVVVTTEPVSKNLCVGENYDLITLTSGAVRAYQWYKDGVAIPGATGPMFRINNAQFNTSGVYSCDVWGFGTCGNSRSQDAHIRVARPTIIVNQTRNAPTVIGGTAHLTLEAEYPNEVLSYQWYKGQDAVVDNGRIQGSKSNHLTIGKVQASDVSNEYTCVVVGVCGTATTKPVRVFTNGVYVEFASNTVATCEGSKVTIKGSAYANPASADVDVRWWYKGSPLSDGGRFSGTGTTSLTIEPVTPEDIGSYVLRATLGSLSDQADVALVIASAPTITAQPQNADACDGASVTLSVTASGQGTLRYTWSKDGAPIPGSSGSSFTIANANPALAGVYTVTVSTDCGSVTSSSATVTVRPATTITQQPPATVSVTVGQPLTISLTASGSGTVQYQWYKDGTQIAGEVAPTFTKAAYAVADEGSYWCVVRSECGEVTSDTTKVTTKPGVVSVDEEAAIAGNVLGTVNPNPASSAATVQLTIAQPSRVNIQLVDATGSTVATIAAVNLGAGSHAFGFDASQYATGVYRLVAHVGSVTLVQPVAIVK